MPRKKKELSHEEFIEKSMQRPLKNILDDLFKSNQKIDEMSKAKICKEGETAISTKELKRLRQVEATLQRILEAAKRETITEKAE